METRIHLLLAIAFLTACFGCSSARWYKAGASQEDFANDKQYCELYARALNDNNTWSRSWTEVAKQKQCMSERGWTKVRPSEEITSASTNSSESRSLASHPYSCHEQCDSLYDSGSLRNGMDRKDCYKSMCK